MPVDSRFLRWLRGLSVIEGISTLCLFGVAMPLKYLGGMPLAVTIVGSIHGALFIAVVLLFLVAIERVPLGVRLGVAGIVGAIFPFGPFVVDRRLKRLLAGADSGQGGANVVGPSAGSG
jgi:integral membrane protein